MQVIINKVCCFGERVEVTLKPLTILLGENSSGESTFLAIAACLLDPKSGFPRRPDFNIAPFELGSFGTMATVEPVTGKPSEYFTIGFRAGFLQRHPLKSVDAETEARVEVDYVNGHGTPFPKTCRVLCNGDSMLCEFDQDLLISRVAATFDGQTFEVKAKESGDSLDLFLSETALLELRNLTDKSKISPVRPILLFELAQRTVYEHWINSKRVVALAPLRAKARRTYDVYSRETSAGEDLPKLLMEVELLNEVARSIDEFGQESGLFAGVNVKKMGSDSIDPHQILVTDNHGLKVNLSDVGYGVSQVLPIVANSLLESKRPTWLLLQQPEVHLHPRAQAAVGSLLAKVSQMPNQHFMVETHSDYLVDRVRLAVSQKVLPASDVQILFFERAGSKTTVHEIGLDDEGNLIDPPEAYGAFFLEESYRMLTR